MKKLVERLSSLTPLLQGKQVNYLPMMVGALKHQGVDDEMIHVTLESFINKMPVGDLGEKLYPKSMFDEYYIHKTNYYLGQLKQKPFDALFGELLKDQHDFGASYEFAGLLRIYYALRSEDQLLIAEALAFFDLSLIKIHAKENTKISFEDGLENIIQEYTEKPVRSRAMKLIVLLTLGELQQYFDSFEQVLSRVYDLFDESHMGKDEITYPSLDDVKERAIISFEEPLQIILKDLLSES